MGKRVHLVALLLVAACLLFNAVVAQAYTATESPAERYGSDLECTANDVSITGISIAPGSPSACVGGDSVNLNLEVTVNFSTPDRYDVGIFFSNDGKDPQLLPANGGASSCTVSVLPDSGQFLDLDGVDNQGNPTGDTCGDGNNGMNGGTGSGVLVMNDVPVKCQAVALSGGKLFIPFVTTWNNQAATSSDYCTSNLDPVPNTKSKCNAPNGTVQADVLSSTVGVVVLPTITKTDGVASLNAGDSTTYAIVVTNTTGATLANAIFQDPAVANLTADSLSCSAAGGATCPASLSMDAMQGGGITLPDMPADSALTFSVGATVSADAPAGTLTNTASVVVDGQSNSASDTDEIHTHLTVAKAFSPASIAAGGTSTLSISLGNTNLSDATGVAFTDSYPANLVNASAPNVTDTCGGAVSVAPGGNSLSLSGGTIPAGGTCTITATVTSSVGGAYTNTTGTVTSDQGFTGEPASASLAVGVSDLSTATKSWQDLSGSQNNPGDVIQYTIPIPETAGVAANNVSVTDAVPSTLTGLTVTGCPSGATCTVSGQTVSASGIAISANGTATLRFDGTIGPGTAPGTTINNCADVNNPGGIGASPCASSLTVSPSAVAQSGNKILYLDGNASMSRTKPSAASSSSVTISGGGGSNTWALTPALASSDTISPNVTPLAIIPVNLYLNSDAADENRTVTVSVACSGGGPTYSETKTFDGTAVNNPYLSTTPTLVSFNNLTVSANNTCAAGQSWDLTVTNSSSTQGKSTGNVAVSFGSSGTDSTISLPSLNVINVDSVTGYSAAYSATTTPAGGYFAPGQTVYLRAVISDPFGSYDIDPADSPTITIKAPNGTTLVTNAAMGPPVASTAATKTYEYAYKIPATGSAGSWSASVTANEGTEGTISDTGVGAFNLGVPDLTVIKSVFTQSDPVNGTNNPFAIPGATMRYEVQVYNFGHGNPDADSLDLSDIIPPDTALIVSNPPVTFIDGTPSSDVSFTYGGLSDLNDDVEFCAGTNCNYVPTVGADSTDPNVTQIKIFPKGTMAADTGSGAPNFKVVFRVLIK